MESSKARQVGELPGAEVKKLCNQFGRDGFTLVEDFGHGDAKQPLRTMHRDESVVGIGVYPHETIHVASGINPSMRQVLVHGLGTAFVGVCQALFRDPRMARIVHTDVSDGKTHGIDTIFDELVMLEASETGVYPLFAYKVGKLGIGHSDVAESLELDMANYPSYRQLDELVPKKGEVAKFVNIEADGDAIDFGIAYRAPTGKIYLITANDTDRTILIIAKILGIPLFHQTIGAFQDNTVTMFSRCLQSLGQYDLMVSGAKK